MTTTWLTTISSTQPLMHLCMPWWREGFEGIPVVVTETGWPTVGGEAASVENALDYNGNVARRALKRSSVAQELHERNHGRQETVVESSGGRMQRLAYEWLDISSQWLGLHVVCKMSLLRRLVANGNVPDLICRNVGKDVD
ncbi:unnamed protein product [Ilex paraguariensis]|uniref:Glucan endo-1,3-beta-D-glucosidase n=1 Tax=Ilex paraguariensis TaxID=185542 RepID=A0ABC8TGD0_9AQUA